MSGVQFLTTLRAAWLRIALMMIVAAGVAFAIASQEPSQYTAKARVMLNAQNTDPSRYSPAKRGIAAGYIGTEMRLMTDDAVTREVVTTLGWPDNPQVIAAWQASGSSGDVTSWAAHRIAINTATRQLEDSSIVEILFSSSSLDAAKQIVGLLRSAYINQSQKLRVEAARRASAWNRTEAARALGVLRAAEAQRAAFVTTNSIAIDTPAGGLDYQAHIEALRSATATTAMTAAAPFNAAADRLANRLNEIDAGLAVVRLRGDRNPVTVMLEAQRAETAQQLARERAVTLGGPGSTAAMIGLVRAQRDADYLKTRLNLIDRAPLYDRLATMDRDIKLKTDRYNAAAGRVADFDAVAATPSGVQVIGDIIGYDEPSYPNIPLMVGIAAGSTFALGVALAILAELSRQQVRGVADLTLVVDAPVLAVIAGAPTGARWWSRVRRLLAPPRPTRYATR